MRQSTACTSTPDGGRGVGVRGSREQQSSMLENQCFNVATRMGRLEDLVIWMRLCLWRQGFYRIQLMVKRMVKRMVRLMMQIFLVKMIKNYYL